MNTFRNGERTVLVDMDGVLADYEEANNEIIRRHFPSVPIVLNRTDFYYKDSYADSLDVVDKIYKENRRPGFFLTFPVVEGAIAGILRIREAGYNPRICTSPLEAHPTVIQEKIKWMEEHLVSSLGANIIDESIFDRDKSAYDAIALIDDRPTVRNMDKASWQHIIFSRSYNLGIATNYRLQSWQDGGLEDLLLNAYNSYLLNTTR